ncbi:MAG TPA: hypothetical protein VGG97_12605 [Bryobacteraceae bacterium]
MSRANLLTRVVMAGALAACTLLGNANGQTAPASDSGTHSWTTEQAVTSSVREAWALGGKTEQGFFQIVQVLTELSAQKRGITLPDDQAAGKKAGDWIKKQAKKDPDQLLYVIVDHAVQYSARKTAAGQ